MNTIADIIQTLSNAKIDVLTWEDFSCLSRADQLRVLMALADLEKAICQLKLVQLEGGK